MALKDLPADVMSSITQIEARALPARRHTIRFDSGHTKSRRTASDIDGFRAFATMNDAQFETLMALEETYALKLSSGERRKVLLMRNNPRYPNLGPFVHRHSMRLTPASGGATAETSIRDVEFHFVDMGPA